MNVFAKIKLKKAIKIAMTVALNIVKDRDPKVIHSFYYGAYDIAPQHLVIWYLFKTNEDLEMAKTNGLTNTIIEATEKTMIQNGYPSEAFIDKTFPMGNYSFANGTEEQQAEIINMLP